MHGKRNGDAPDHIREHVNILYKVTATAVMTRGVYMGLMTVEGFRQELESNPGMFSIKWKILEVSEDSVDQDGYGRVIARNGKGD